MVIVYELKQFREHKEEYRSLRELHKKLINNASEDDLNLESVLAKTASDLAFIENRMRQLIGACEVDVESVY